MRRWWRDEATSNPLGMLHLSFDEHERRWTATLDSSELGVEDFDLPLPRALRRDAAQDVLEAYAFDSYRTIFGLKHDRITVVIGNTLGLHPPPTTPTAA